MTVLAKALAATGILPVAVLREFKKWGLPVEVPEIPEDTPSPDTPVLLRSLQAALEEDGFEVIPETDLEAIHNYMDTIRRGTLVVVIGDQKAEFPVAFGRDKAGRYLLPWKAEGILDEMVNGQTHLVISGDDSRPSRVYFSDVRELFYGKAKTFMVCSVAQVENFDNGT